MNIFSKKKRNSHQNSNSESSAGDEDEYEYENRHRNDTSVMDILVDSGSDEDEIFDDDDEDDDRSTSDRGSRSGSYRDMVSQGANKEINALPSAIASVDDEDDKDYGSRDGSYSDASDAESDNDNDATDDDHDDEGSQHSQQTEDEDEDSQDDNDEKHGSDSGEDYTDDEDEGEDGYKPGGYHRVKIGEVYNQRYVVIKKLGWGHFSTVWMVKDRKAVQNNEGEPFLALKVQKSADHYTEAAMDEVELLDCIHKERNRQHNLPKQKKDSDKVTAGEMAEFSKYCATLHDSFFHSGSNGRHMCMVFSMLGCNLLSVIKTFSYRGIPIPVVKNMIRGICKGLDFLHRKCQIIHTDLKPENVLLLYDQGDSNGTGNLTNSMARLSIGNDGGISGNQRLAESIKELEDELQNTNLSPAERKRLKRRLKKKRQKARKKIFGIGGDGGDVGDDASDDDDDDDDDDDEEESSDDAPNLSDMELTRMLNNASNLVSPRSTDDGVVPATSSVKRRLNHSPFVTSNFGHRYEQADSKLMGLLQTLIDVRRPSADEFSNDFNSGSSSTDGDSNGVAEIAFMLRAFTPEEELAEGVSAALGGIPWEFSEDKSKREWRCKITAPTAGRYSMAPTSPSTSFQIIQKCRNKLDAEEKQIFSDLALRVGANLSGEADRNEGTNKNSKRALPYSLFKLRFPVPSTYVVLSFLESRLHGVVFLTYRRDEGNPLMDDILFGPQATSFCDHPLAMRSKSDNPGKSSSVLSTCMFGFDLRQVKDFQALPSLKEDGSASLDLDSPSLDRVLGWWIARNPIMERAKAFLGFDPTSVVVSALGHKDAKHSNDGPDDNFIEGGKKPHENNSSSIISPKPSPPDLCDTNALLETKSVIVDLGNACWTHRHFSEDIQTRQYRAPEVLIGSKYNTSADMWSLGCMTFELLTGDLLFDPRAGDDYDRDEDHLAMFQELLGRMPKRLALEGKYAKQFFDKKGSLKHIKSLKFWPIQDVLVEKYHFAKEDADAVADFMRPLLDFDPKTRATALDALRHKWLR
eukprot:CAMPEP_0197197190 /NCGR_PEP_ID=MMETSP1423-20130617/32737_1 /TAXON_ID=476441 /ORGANISM="Pseudo-nitzschia heimii, Strain UNC1101" /LENGTH=1030 /DNA_ID=CAMNT_0042651007 /DNA_START=343 /DNA_END=3435 /DNA_ORIENTATION=-